MNHLVPGSSAGRFGSRAADHVMLAIVMAGTVGRLVFVWNASMVDLMQRSTDDSYYYFNVAKNIVGGFGITFDRINITNGFHPLWMLVLLPVVKAAGSDPDTILRAIFCVVGLVTGVACWAAYKTISIYTSRTAAAFGAGLLLVPVFLNSFLNGLETGLLLLLLFSATYAIARYDLLSLRAMSWQNAVLGTLLALVVLCRLDAIFIVCAIVGLFWVRWGLTVGSSGFTSVIWTTVRVSLIPILAVSAYLLWNLAVFGHASPISGALKSTFPTNTFVPRRLVEPHRLYGEMQVVLTAVGSLWLNRGGGGWTLAVPPILVALWVGSVVHLIYSMLYMGWAAHWWHFASYTPMTIMMAALVFDRMLAGSRRPALFVTFGALGLFAAVGLGFYVDGLARALHHRPWYEAALWARANLPEDAVVGMTDAGLFGYFSRRPTVNLDGVINGYEYQRALRDHRLAEYLARSGVTHIADYEVRYRNGTYLIRLPSRLYRQPGGAIGATRAAEVYGSAPYPERFFGAAGEIHFAIWDLRGLRIVDDVRGK